MGINRAMTRRVAHIMFGAALIGLLVSWHTCLHPTTSSSASLPAPAVLSDYRGDNNVYSLQHQEGQLEKQQFSEEDLTRRFPVLPNGSNVIVFLRIQKTGSTEMTKHLENLDLSAWCKCHRCSCYRHALLDVLYHLHGGGPYNQHKWTCGLHADWTYLRACIDGVMAREYKRTAHARIITMVRDPVRRYLSEFEQVRQFGTTWFAPPTICNGKRATPVELPPCSANGKTWENVTLESFMSCKSNLAVNRQTRMLADLTQVNCYNTSGMSYEERHLKMLESAKQNLKNMAFFGLTEYQELSEALFTTTFNLTFQKMFKTQNRTRSSSVVITERERLAIRTMNRFDGMLYEFALDLFFQRLRRVGLISKVI